VVHAITQIPGGARGIYHLSAAIHHGPSNQIHLYGSAGTLKYLFDSDQLLFGKAGDEALAEVVIPNADEGGWRVEEEFINAILGREEIAMARFETGLQYMEFTEAVHLSAQSGEEIALPF
jgi:predicted dehydrogenase